MYPYLLPSGTWDRSCQTDSWAGDAKATLLSAESLDALTKPVMRLLFAVLGLRARHASTPEPAREADAVPDSPPASRNLQ